MRLKDSILIRCSRDALYTLLSDIESHTQILPGYIESRIIEPTPNGFRVQREAIINGKRRRWKSDVWFDAGKAIHFQQAEGLLKGMHVEWQIDSNAQFTRLRIIHDVTVQPRWRGWWIERLVAKPAIERTARVCLEAIKNAAETRRAA